MRFETSYFSLTLYAKHLKRYWPMWALWLLAWTLAMPIQLWNGLSQRQARSSDSFAPYAGRATDFSGWVGPTSIFIAVAAIVAAAAVTFYLYKGTPSSFIYALPMRREGVFATSWLAGYTMLMGPLAVVAVVTALIEAGFGVFDPSVFVWLGYAALLAFFWFNFAMLCCVFTGNTFAGMAFYGIFNALVYGMTILVQLLLEAFLYGFSVFGPEVWEMATWFTPIVRLSAGTGVLNAGGVTQIDMVCRYAAIGFLMLLGAVYLHHIRKAERAGDIIAFKYLRYIFKWAVTICGGLAFGMVLYAVVFSTWSDISGLGLAVCCAAAAAISRFVAEMFIRKSLKVFKAAWKGAAVAAVCFALAVCAVDMDWIGFTTRVPDAAQVKYATAEFYGSVDPVARNEMRYEGRDVEALVELHRWLTENRSDGPAPNGYRYYRVELTYQLGLTRMTRSYSAEVPADGEGARRFEGAITAGTPDFDVSRGVPYYMYLGTETGGTELDAAQRRALWQAVTADVEAGNYRAQAVRPTEDVVLEMQWLAKDDSGMVGLYQTFYLREGAVNTRRAVEELGLLELVEDGKPTTAARD